jgi:MoaA/NifB/PqqE/SkfB family radical SAM enzyme
VKKINKSYRAHRISNFLRHTTPKRLANYFLAHARYRLGVSQFEGFPPLVYIDPLNYCNLRCPLCPTGQHVRERAGGKMPYDLYLRLVDEIAGSVYFLNLYNWGEPLLHPQIFDMVKYAAGKGLSVRISSNLNRMTPEQARQMVESGLEELLVDLDGATQETYETYRVGGKLSLVTEHVRQIVEAKKQLKSPFPLITARTLVNRHNQSEIGQIESLAWSLGVDVFETAPIYVNLSRPDDVIRWLTDSSQQGTATRRPDRPRKCKYLWLNLTVSWDGGVFPCCWFHQKNYDFGTTSNGEKLIQVLSNNRFVQSRHFVAGQSQLPPDTICARCKGYPEYDYSYD